MELNKVIYLSVPYTKIDHELSFDISNKVAARLMAEGNTVFSPISHSHPIAQYIPSKLRESHRFWMSQDMPILSICDELIIVVIKDKGMDFIKDSVGCNEELHYANEHGIPVTYMDFDL